MANSPLSSFNTYLLEFTPRGAGVQADVNGNPQRVQNSNKIPIRCTLRATADPRILPLVGADASSAVVTGRCVAPMRLPPEIKPGMTCLLVVGGIKGVFTLGQAWPSGVPEIADALGEKIVGSWKAG